MEKRKEEAMENNTSMKAGTAGGILFVLINISTQEIFKTAVLASIGAAVSFTVSLLLKTAVKKLKER
jgi:Na+-translocating ferredoxin:NAD+ oxidoreductase RnfA subunit